MNSRRRGLAGVRAVSKNNAGEVDRYTAQGEFVVVKRLAGYDFHGKVPFA